MDENNDIQVNKVDKWRAGVADASLWQAKKSVDIFLCGYSSMLSIEALDAVRTIYVALDEALDRFNELEARHQKDTGMISEYEEENKKLKGYLDIRNDDCDTLISKVFKQNNDYIKLESENEELRSKCESKEDTLKKMIQEVTELEKEKIKLEDQLVQQKRLEVQTRVNASNASTYKSEIKQIIELAKSYGIIIYDDRKDAIPDNVVNIGMCGHYYVLDKDLKNEINRLTDRCDEFAYRAAKYALAIKIMLKKAFFSPGRIADELGFMARESTTPKDVYGRWEGYADEFLDERSKLVDKINRLVEKNEELKKENNSLRRTARILDGEGYF